MNITQKYINSWSKKIIKESIDNGKYDPSMDEFPQSDEQNPDEYENWMREREKIMKDLTPKSANEGCCDEEDKENNLSATPAPIEKVPEDGEGGDEGGDAGDVPTGEGEENANDQQDILKQKLQKLNQLIDKAVKSDKIKSNEKVRNDLQNLDKKLDGVIKEDEGSPSTGSIVGMAAIIATVDTLIDILLGLV